MSYYPDEQNNQMIPMLDVNALTPRARNRLMQHMDQEGETAMKSTISLQRIVAVGNRAIVAYANVAQLGAQAAEVMPEEAERQCTPTAYSRSGLGGSWIWPISKSATS